MTRSYQPHVMLIREALAHIRRYQPADEKAFIANRMAQDAILMRLQEIGGNLARIRRINEEMFSSIADESWFELIGLRNVISHGYHQIRADRIWHILVHEIGPFEETLQRVPTDQMEREVED